MKLITTSAALCIAGSLVETALAHKSTMASTPQMGWNTWNTFKTDFNASVIENVIELFDTLGLKKAGYSYVLLDEGWSAMNRTADGYLQADSTKFPDGIKSLSDKVHSNGLKIGLYGDSGILTCGFSPGSWGYEERDAQTLADWEIDYWKYDNCGGFQAMTDAPQIRYKVMQDALLRTGREIFYSLCEWGYQFPWHWGGQIGHSYRMSGDITDKFMNETSCDCKTAYCLITGSASCSVTTIMRKMREVSQYQEKGHWMDMDMLEIGNGNMTLNMEQTHFAFWAALKSPLIIGADISKLSDESVSVLTNREIIAINQDSLGEPVHYVEKASTEDELQVWVGDISRGKVVLVFNEKNYDQKISVPLSNLGLGISRKVAARELWSGKYWGKISSINTTLKPYQTLVFRLAA